MKTFVQWFFVLTVLIGFACDKYSPSGENDVLIQPPDIDVSIDLSTPIDTIRGSGIIRLRYAIDMGTKEFSRAVINIDDKWRYETDSLNTYSLRLRYRTYFVMI
ncbi:hypothetical protein JNM05_07785 [bacterium]|nr:hypothetical protein [bacterium]